MNRLPRFWIRTALVVAALLPGCARTPVSQPPATSLLYVEGLETIDTKFPGILLVRPDHHMASYDQAMVDPILLTYRTSSQKFSATETEKLKNYLREAAARELVNLEPSQIATEPGPCVLRIQTAFIDLELPDLPERGASASTFVDSFGTVTLVHQIIDSQTGDLLLRYVGRWRAGGGPVIGGGDPWVHMTSTFDRLLHELQQNLLESVPHSVATSGPRTACGGQINRTIEAAHPGWQAPRAD